jgi:transposase-like protein
VQRFTPLLIDAARPCRHVAGDRWFVDETYVKVSGVWRYVYRAVDQQGQVIDVYVSQRRDIASARTFFTAALTVHGVPTAVITDRAPALANVIEDLVPAALHSTAQYENNPVECDHGRLKARLRPMRGLKTERTASVVIRGARVRPERASWRLTTSWGSTPYQSSGWPPHSTNSGPQSDQPVPGPDLGLPCDQTTQQSQSESLSQSACK